MKRLFILLFFTVLSASSICNSQNFVDSKIDEDKLIYYNISQSKYPYILNKILMKSDLINLNISQQNRIKFIRENILVKMNNNVEEYKKNKLEISLLTRNPEFDVYRVRKLTYRNNFLHNEINTSYINSLNMIRNILGAENFHKIFISDEIILSDSNTGDLNKENMEESSEDIPILNVQ